MYLYANMTHAEREKRRLAECTVDQYVAEWLDGYKGNLSVLTYNNYKLMADTRIAKYFQKLGVPLKEITGDELNDFYAYLRNDGLSGASAQRYHSLLHIAFKHAVKRGIILANPCDRADRPKATQYIASYYNQE